MLIYLTRFMVRFFEPCALLSSELSENLFELERSARKKIVEVATCKCPSNNSDIHIFMAHRPGQFTITGFPRGNGGSSSQ